MNMLTAGTESTAKTTSDNSIHIKHKNNGVANPSALKNLYIYIY
jgi:hypothetical protein